MMTPDTTTNTGNLLTKIIKIRKPRKRKRKDLPQGRQEREPGQWRDSPTVLAGAVDLVTLLLD